MNKLLFLIKIINFKDLLKNNYYILMYNNEINIYLYLKTLLQKKNIYSKFYL